MIADAAGCKSSPPPSPTTPPPAFVRPPTPSPQPVLHVAPTTAPATGDALSVATVHGVTITRSDLYRPLVESYGLPMLQTVMLLKLSQQVADQNHVTVTPADVRTERTRMLADVFPDAPAGDDETLLDQLLKQQNITRPQFEMVLQTNANLRKVVEPHLPAFTDDQLRQAFGLRYGENRQVSDIEVPNMRVAAEVKQRLDAGEPFGQVASEFSDDPRTRNLGGELPPFSAQSPNMPQAIRDAVFSMQVGKVSDVVQDGSSYHILKLERIFPPRVVKFEDVKESVRKILQDSWIRLAIRQLREQLSQEAIQTVHIDDPELNAQWQKRLEQQKNRPHDRDMIREELNRMHATTAPAAAGPATTPTTMQ